MSVATQGPHLEGPMLGVMFSCHCLEFLKFINKTLTCCIFLQALKFMLPVLFLVKSLLYSSTPPNDYSTHYFLLFLQCPLPLSCSVLFYYQEDENNQKTIFTFSYNYVWQPTYICTNINLGFLLLNWENISSFYLNPLLTPREHEFYPMFGLLHPVTGQ